ncbi:hypothetical protein Btru_076358 [Bulinus truncatus]|nr:hypothetical protein Btru_076358 [Bulinus truncatus]
MFLIVLVFSNTGTCQSDTKGWEKKKADIYFLADASSSVWRYDFIKQLKFISDLVNEMDIGPNYTRVGLGVFSDRFKQHIPLNNNMTKVQLMDAINQAPYLMGDGYISRGLDGLRKQGLTPDVWRDDVPHASLLITDGPSRYLQLSLDNATLAKKDGIYLFSVAVGRSISWNELTMISSDPPSDYIFQVDDFVSLSNIRTSLSSKLSQVEFLQKEQGTCGEKTHMDVLFLFDEYGYGKLASNKIKKFLQNVSEDLSINSGHIRVGVVSKTCHEGEITFIQNLKREKFIESLNVDNGPDISTLLKHVRRNVFLDEKGARDFAKRRLVAFLYGDTRSNVEVYREFIRNKNEGIEVFIVYTNTDHNKNYLGGLASSQNHILYLSSTDELLKRKPDFLKMFCADV